MRRWSTQETLGVSCGRPSGLSSIQRVRDDFFHGQSALTGHDLSLKPRGTGFFAQRYGGPLATDRVEVDWVSVRCQENPDVFSVLLSERDKFRDDQPLRRKHPELVAWRANYGRWA